ncbi:MAG: hypothetical protein U0519_00105 [Candidatus Gracilibacteria bacterium]
MTFPRFFSPSVTARLFDPMPLPRSIRIKRVGKTKAKLPRTSSFATVSFKVKKIPMNR